MTFEEKLDDLLELQAEIDYLDGAYPATSNKLLKDFDKAKVDLLADYNLLEGEYRSWSALALAWFKWASEEDSDPNEYSFKNAKGYEDLVDRTIVEVG